MCNDKLFLPVASNSFAASGAREERSSSWETGTEFGGSSKLMVTSLFSLSSRCEGSSSGMQFGSGSPGRRPCLREGAAAGSLVTTPERLSRSRAHSRCEPQGIPPGELVFAPSNPMIVGLLCGSSFLGTVRGDPFQLGRRAVTQLGASPGVSCSRGTRCFKPVGVFTARAPPAVSCTMRLPWVGVPRSGWRGCGAADWPGGVSQNSGAGTPPRPTTLSAANLRIAHFRWEAHVCGPSSGDVSSSGDGNLTSRAPFPTPLESGPNSKASVSSWCLYESKGGGVANENSDTTSPSYRTLSASLLSQTSAKASFLYTSRLTSTASDAPVRDADTRTPTISWASPLSSRSARMSSSRTEQLRAKLAAPVPA
mmetsp:Transcript_6264/g.11774  ORF Transcript_6264/g.11774 Transcript_6264/m.11774 type:complete len:367 (-) Transcript_6264:373-1473(-)